MIAFADNLTRAFPLFANFQKWQMALILVGLPGFIFAGILLLLREPARGRGGTEATASERLPLREVMAAFWERRSFYGRYYAGIFTIGTVQLGFPLWYPSILIRTHGMSMAETGLKMGAISLLAATVGTLIGPNISAALERRGRPDGPWLTAKFSCILLAAVCFTVPYVSAGGALIVAGAIVFLAALPLGAIIAAMQNATHSRMRGTAASIQTFSAQVVGYMISPTVTALITDYVFKDPKMVGHSFQIVSTIAAIGAVFFFSTIYRHHTRLLEINLPS